MLVEIRMLVEIMRKIEIVDQTVNTSIPSLEDMMASSMWNFRCIVMALKWIVGQEIELGIHTPYYGEKDRFGW